MNLIAASTALPAGTLMIANDDALLDPSGRLSGREAVALHFPKWTDGRAYSQAVVLRGRLRFAGDIVATGDVVVDMLPLLRRCGFTAAQLRADQRRESAERVLGLMPSPYQRTLAERAGAAA